MTYSEVKQDLFDCDDSWYLAHCISADFALGAGIAKEFDRRFDMNRKLRESFPDYINRQWREYCFEAADAILIDRVFNLVTKERYWQKPTLDSLGIALILVRDHCHLYGTHLRKLAMPKIGCGLDRLNWEDVKPMIFKLFGDTDIEIRVCCLE